MARKDKSILSKGLNRKIERNSKNADSLINDLNNSIYGVDASEELDELQSKFNEIMKSEVGKLTKNDGDITSLLNKLYSKNKNDNAFNRAIDQDFLSLNMDGMDSTLAMYMNDAYKNRILKQADIHQVSSQLIELKEALHTMRDAIVSPDINTGRINRLISFGDAIDDKDGYYTSTIEAMEEKFDLSKKIKDFIVNYTLEFGEYYMYCVPYKVIFNDFMRKKANFKSSAMYSVNESAEDEVRAQTLKRSYTLASDSDADTFVESCFEKIESARRDSATHVSKLNKDYKIEKEKFTTEFKELLGRVTVNMEEIPLPVLEEGIDSLENFREKFVNESGDAKIFEEARNDKVLYSDKDNKFKSYMKKSDSADGLFFANTKTTQKDQFEDVKDCYLKMVSPTQLIPITMMDEELGYLYLKAEPESVLSGLVSTGMFNKEYDEHNRQKDIVSDIAARIVNRFDKKFLKENSNFKKLIVEAINYYDLTENRITFQYIPKEYIFAFKVNVDENNKGVSMLEDALFYAKLYLMLLLFKMMSIIMFSNDQKVNYVRQSGIDKNLANNVQSIIRQKQARCINMMDLFSYTTLINKVGSGMEAYIPTGRNNERPVETEILSGQEVQLNTELMELLRNSYILATGVPSAIMNYLNEADFAKSIETANSKFNGRVINYQIDLNPQITELYRALARWSTNIPEDVINQMTVTLPVPKNNQINVTNEMIQNFSATSDFLTKLYYGDQPDPNDEANIKLFTKNLARKKLTIFNWDEIDEIFDETQKEATETKMLPKGEEDIDNQLNI